MTLEQLQERKILLKKQIDDLTYELKSMSGTSSNYGFLWDKRVGLKEQLRSIENLISIKMG